MEWLLKRFHLNGFHPKTQTLPLLPPQGFSPVFISPIVWNMCENLHYESVYFKELHNQQEYY